MTIKITEIKIHPMLTAVITTSGDSSTGHFKELPGIVVTGDGNIATVKALVDSLYGIVGYLKRSL